MYQPGRKPSWGGATSGHHHSDGNRCVEPVTRKPGGVPIEVEAGGGAVDLGWAGYSLSCNTSEKVPSGDAFPHVLKAGWSDAHVKRPKQGRGRSRYRPSDPRKGRGYRKLWEQVTRVGCGGSLHRDTFTLSDVSVEDLVHKVVCLPAEEQVGNAVATALLYLDSRAVAALLKELAKAGKVARAVELFDWLRDLPPAHELASLCDVYTYTTDISLCGQQKALRRALELMAELRSRGLQCNVHTFSAFMNVCTKCGELQLALEVFRQMKAEGCKPNVVTYNTLIDVYGKLGQWRKAVEVLDIATEEGLTPEIRTYNTAIIACNMCNQPYEALKVYDRLLDSGQTPTATTCTALISAYSKAEMYEKAFDTYDDMVAKHLERGLITYVALMGTCEKAGAWELALKYFHNMEKEGCSPNTVIYNSLIAALCYEGQWQWGNEIYKKMIAQGNLECKPDISTWMALLNAYDRAGQWEEARKLFNGVLESGYRVDPVFYYAVIDILWCTGIAHMQVKAVQFLNTLSLRDKTPLGVQTTFELNVLEVVVRPLSVGYAIITVHTWLMETRWLMDRDVQYLADSNVVLCIGRGRNNMDGSVRSVKDSLVAMFGSVGAPFCASEDEHFTSRLQCSGYSLRLWLQDPDCFSCITALVCSQDQINVPESLSEASSGDKYADAYSLMRKFESTHQLDYEAMGTEYISQRSKLVNLACKMGSQLELEDVTVHDAVLLMDRVMSTGAKLQQGIAAVAVAALLQIAAEGAEHDKMCQNSHLGELLKEFPAGAMEELVFQIKACLRQDTAAVSAKHIATLYIEQLGYDKAPKWGAASLVHIRFLLHRTMLSSAFLNFRPSVTAAAIIYYDRFVRGWVPFWPTALARITGYEDLGAPEISGAIQALFDMKNMKENPQNCIVALGS